MCVGEWGGGGGGGGKCVHTYFTVCVHSLNYTCTPVTSVSILFLVHSLLTFFAQFPEVH